jgi:hypothetical protein
VYQVNGSRVELNPCAARLREPTDKMPNAAVTESGNAHVKARVDPRSIRSTYLVEDSTNSHGQTITRAEYERVASLQDAHIAASHMVVVDGVIGSDPKFRTRARLAWTTSRSSSPASSPARPGRAGEHAAMATRLEQERKEFLGSFAGLDESLIKSPGLQG